MNDIKLGNVIVTRVEESHGPIMPTDAFFPTIPAEAWPEHEDELVPDHLGAQDHMVRVAMQSWILRSEGRTILVDAGVGNDKNRPAVEAWHLQKYDYLDRLAAAGVRPEDVDVVVNTHLHADHVGWNTRLVDGEWTPTFPNATYFMPAADFEHWNPANNPGIKGGVNENVFEDSIAPIQAAGRVRLWAGEHQLDANLTLRDAPGHTPGSSVIMLESGSDRALLAGDILHTPLQLMLPDHSSCFCEDPQTALGTRQRLLSWAADHNALVLPAHFSGHSALEIERRGSAFGIKQWAAFPRY
jgi:glyoxylase-like metal-dependent hydrolase (beta-lactamase superfamily II)